MEAAVCQKRTKTNWPTVSPMPPRGIFALFWPFRCVNFLVVVGVSGKRQSLYITV